MSTDALGAVLSYSRSRGAARLVLLGIADNAGPDYSSYPTARWLANWANIAPEEVPAQLAALEALGEIAVVGRGFLGNPAIEPERFAIEMNMERLSGPEWAGDSEETERYSR